MAKRKPHADLKHACIEFLRLNGHVAWGNNTGAFAGEYGGKRRFVRFSVKGASDVFAVLRPSGRFLAVEVKVGKDRLRPEQIAFMESIRAAGGAAIEVRSLDDLTAELIAGAGKMVEP